MTDQFKVWVTNPVIDIGLATSEKVVDDSNIVP
jgi:hypothetical protein